ncbi:MAG: ester cyclase [Mucilaginibacter sp.]|jgi:predicted ester cyclase|uniref:ester cyclase n=1 Tax=Mucilaginibacter sp. TaxID=1882438 RepID=UPI003568D07E
MDLSENYRNYIACINARELNRLDEFVSGDVVYNGRSIGIDGYRDMLAGNYHDIPDLRFVVELLVADTSAIASRLYFNCKPSAEFRGLQINGQRIEFHENVFYRYRNGKIAEVWSVIDKAEIERQLVP